MSLCVLIAFTCLSMSPSVCYDTETHRHKSKEAHQHKTKSKEPQRHRDTQAHTNTDIDTNTKRHTDTQRPGPTSQVGLRHLVQLVQLMPLAARLRLSPSDPMQTWQADSRAKHVDHCDSQARSMKIKDRPRPPSEPMKTNLI